MLNKDSRSWLPVAPKRATCDQRGPRMGWAPRPKSSRQTRPNSSGGIRGPTEPHMLVCKVGCGAGLPAPRVMVTGA